MCYDRVCFTRVHSHTRIITSTTILPVRLVPPLFEVLLLLDACSNNNDLRTSGCTAVCLSQWAATPTYQVQLYLRQSSPGTISTRVAGAQMLGEYV